MKKFSKVFLLISFITFAFIFLPALAHAQISNPGCDPGCNCVTDPGDGHILYYCPIDSGVIALLIVGVLYGAVKIRSDYKKRMPAA
jgi:hypothetical protein